MASVDIQQALDESADVIDVFLAVYEWPEASPFAGGVWTDWPRKHTQGLSICRAEMAAVRALHLKENSNG